MMWEGTIGCNRISNEMRARLSAAVGERYRTWRCRRRAVANSVVVRGTYTSRFVTVVT